MRVKGDPIIFVSRFLPLPRLLLVVVAAAAASADLTYISTMNLIIIFRNENFSRKKRTKKKTVSHVTENLLLFPTTY